MLFRTLTKEGFRSLAEMILENNEIIAPRKVADGKNGKPIHQYLPVENVDQIDLGYETTDISAKTYFLPFQEKLSTFSFDEDDWEQEIRYRIQPRAIIGLHACDINALLKLDKVMAKDFYPSPYYISRRQNTFIVGIDHEPCAGGFCRSLGTDTVTRGFDLFLTDLGDRYFTAIGSDRGFTAVQKVGAREITDADTQDYLRVRKHISELFEEQVDVRNLPNLMDIEFESPVWEKFGDRCLSCGSCAMVCPTCYCYGVTERISMDFKRGSKTKYLYSCCIVDFAQVAGGHNFRPDRKTRLKYRYYHQHRGFVEAYQEPKCVGCGRCARTCFAGINPTDVIRELQAQERT
jgi:sulfhydrogenase subunit beta (sulfur reductase)